MRLSRILTPVSALLLLAACGVDDGPTSNARPPLAGVVFIHAMPDEGPVDARMIDQTQWSAYALGINFRQSSPRMAAQAGSRSIRVWRKSTDVDQVMLIEQNVTIEAGQNVTLLLTGSVQGGTARIEVIPDNPPDSASGQIHVRAVNTTDAAAEVAWVTGGTAGTPVSVSPLGTSAYTAFPMAAVTASFFAPGAPGTTWEKVAPAGEPQTEGKGATAGYSASGSALSAYLFPPSVPGSLAPQDPEPVVGGDPVVPVFAIPGIIWFVDRVPAPPR